MAGAAPGSSGVPGSPRPASIAAARAATVGWANRVLTVTSAPVDAAIRATAFAAAREWPPDRKKSSSRPTGRASRPAKISATVVSRPGWGSGAVVSSAGGGRARTFSFPELVNGNASTVTIADGTR
ncbi:hypothetical protein SGRI78S_06748 [Streptomyces griseus subsp. griseus]